MDRLTILSAIGGVTVILAFVAYQAHLERYLQIVDKELYPQGGRLKHQQAIPASVAFATRWLVLPLAGVILIALSFHRSPSRTSPTSPPSEIPASPTTMPTGNRIEAVDLGPQPRMQAAIAAESPGGVILSEAPPPWLLQGAAGTPQTITSLSDGKATDPMALSPSLVDTDIDVVGSPGPPKRLFIDHVQPVRPKGSRAVMRIQNLSLLALEGRQSMIGGLDKDAPPGTEPAPILVLDCMLDNRIKLGSNVYQYQVKVEAPQPPPAPRVPPAPRHSQAPLPTKPHPDAIVARAPRVGDTINVRVSGGDTGVVVSGGGGASISIPPHGSMTVPGKIIGDLGMEWQVELSMSVGGRSQVAVPK